MLDILKPFLDEEKKHLEKDPVLREVKRTEERVRKLLKELRYDYGISFVNCPHTTFFCRCHERRFLDDMLILWKNGMLPLSREYMTNWVIKEYSVQEWGEDNFFILKYLKRFGL